VKIAHNSITTMLCTYELDTRIARETGSEGIFLVGSKLVRYLESGHAIDEAKAHLRGLPVAGIGNVRDIERRSEEDRSRLLTECESICRLAAALGASSVQLLTGPLEPLGSYSGLGNVPWAELRASTASNLAEISRIGREHGVHFYLEGLAWTPLNRIDQALEVIEAADVDNVHLALDFWHLWHAGTTPDDLARVDASRIWTVDVGDAIGAPGEIAGPDQRGRSIWPGEGSIPMKAWVDAIRSTGFDGWWTAELLSPFHWESDPWRIARDVRVHLDGLLQGEST
jgi:sugar phosphate isomerase/epimerase